MAHRILSADPSNKGVAMSNTNVTDSQLADTLTEMWFEDAGEEDASEGVSNRELCVWIQSLRADVARLRNEREAESG